MGQISSAPADRAAIARQTAKMMLEIKAIHFNAESPFFFTSGWASPVYVDCRKIISYPRLRSGLMDFSSQVILSEIGYESIDNIAGGETAGIPFAAWIADKLMLPMQYIRKKAKGFGRNAQIEGDLPEGARTLLVEDLATDGRSKVNFCNALRKAGATVDHCFVLFYYDIFPESKEQMRDLNVTLHYLATWWDVLQVAEESGHFDAGVLREVRSFLNQPSQWSAAHGGISENNPSPQADKASAAA
ncbi:MAG: Orotate phosphoribosyltransferase [Pseudolabrys sp.]|jgi:orotate phosphoribosyltransferase|nr:Orotate phosphoribosyltransferase [Pseudolabrys sp.]